MEEAISPVATSTRSRNLTRGSGSREVADNHLMALSVEPVRAVGKGEQADWVKKVRASGRAKEAEG